MSVTTVTIPTPKSALPQWAEKDQPVPWVTRWTNEVNQTKLQVSITRDGLTLSYADGNEDRDAFGVLWKREGITRGGTPQFSEINTYRQRAAMNKCLCQVCGKKIQERPIRWLMSRASLHHLEDGTALTISAPTCSPCIPLAVELCPHLKTSDPVILRVLEYEKWGVYGEAVHYDEEGGRARDLRGVYVPYVNSPIPLAAAVGFQQVVRLTKFAIEEKRES